MLQRMNPVSVPSFLPFSCSGILESTLNNIPEEVLTQIFSTLDRKDLESCRSVNRQWRRITTDSNLFFPPTAFGKEKYAFYFGDVFGFGDDGKEPPLPSDIYEILKGPCPFWKAVESPFPFWEGIEGQRVEMSHMLVLIPATVNGKPLTLNSLREAFKNPKNNSPSINYRTYNQAIEKEFGEIPVGSSYWALITQEIIPSSEVLRFNGQKN